MERKITCIENASEKYRFNDWKERFVSGSRGDWFKLQDICDKYHITSLEEANIFNTWKAHKYVMSHTQSMEEILVMTADIDTYDDGGYYVVNDGKVLKASVEDWDKAFELFCSEVDLVKLLQEGVDNE